MTNNPFGRLPYEMAKYISQKDWTHHPLGPIEQWPAELIIGLSNMLSSKSPKFMYWGTDLFCFYNDAFIPSLSPENKEHQQIGKRAKDAWPNLYGFIKENTDGVFKNGNPTFYENLLLPVYKNGTLEDAYWTFSHSAMYDVEGNVCGVMVTNQETTQTMLDNKMKEAGREKFYKLLMQAPMGLCVLEGEDYVFTMANEHYLNFIHKTKEEVVDKKLFDVLPEVEDNIKDILDNVRKSGTPFFGHEYEVQIMKNGVLEDRLFNFVYNPIKNEEGNVVDILAAVIDVTEIAVAKKGYKDVAERLRMATENSKIATWELEVKTRKIIHSEHLAFVFGHPKDAILTHEQMRSQVFEEDRNNILLPAFEEALRNGVYKYEARIWTLDGDVKWIKTYGQLYYDENGDPDRMIGILQDITESKINQQLLEISEGRYRNLANLIPQFIWMTDRAGKPNYWNNAMLEYTGLTEEYLNDNWLEIIHPDDREGNIKTWMKSVQDGVPYSFEHRFRSKDGDYNWQISRGLPVMDEAGEILYWIGASTDIDKIKREEMLRKDFIKMANHELKTPVTTVKGYVQLLLRTQSPEKDPVLYSTLQTIDNQVKKLTTLVGDLLDVSKIEIGSLPLNKENLELVGLVKDSVKEIQATTETHKVNFNATGLDEIFVFADKYRINQVLINLFTNAIKYSPNCDHINITMEKQGNYAKISVQDFGIGIEEGEQQKIFQQFYRVWGNDENTYPGFGIGLFIVSEILERHQGSINVESKKGLGSTFNVLLPIKQA